VHTRHGSDSGSYRYSCYSYCSSGFVVSAHPSGCLFWVVGFLSFSAAESETESARSTSGSGSGIGSGTIGSARWSGGGRCPCLSLCLCRVGRVGRRSGAVVGDCVAVGESGSALVEGDGGSLAVDRLC
jgi:hypothetical protein